jgi:hypothetical protein
MDNFPAGNIPPVPKSHSLALGRDSAIVVYIKGIGTLNERQLNGKSARIPLQPGFVALQVNGQE